MIIRDKRKSGEIPFSKVGDYDYFHELFSVENEYEDLILYQKVPTFAAVGANKPEINAIDISGGFNAFSSDAKVVPVEIEIMVVE